MGESFGQHEPDLLSNVSHRRQTDRPATEPTSALNHERVDLHQITVTLFLTYSREQHEGVATVRSSARILLDVTISTFRD